MFWTIFYGIGTLWVAAGNSLAPNNILTAAWWIVGIIGLIPSFLLLETNEMHKKRNMEEAEWYISTYQRLWFAKDPFTAISKFGQVRIGANMNDYKTRKMVELHDDIWSNWQRKYFFHTPLKDTYLETMGFMAICSPGSPLYCPQYIGIVNDEEKLKNWKPTIKK